MAAFTMRRYSTTSMPSGNGVKSWGIISVPARYVSGHLYRREGAIEQPAAHAWAEAWVDDLGWVGFDPANATCPDEAYIRVAIGLDYRDAAPLSGARAGGGTESLFVGVTVSQAQAQSQS